jgi:hypothetical protein
MHDSRMVASACAPHCFRRQELVRINFPEANNWMCEPCEIERDAAAAKIHTGVRACRLAARRTALHQRDKAIGL